MVGPLTFGDLLDGPYEVHIFCPRCLTSRRLDLAALCAAGWGEKSYRGRVYRCRTCASRGEFSLVTESAPYRNRR